jgi:transformation/transcription domain-associated protein
VIQQKCAGYAGIDHFTACLSSLFDCLHVENLQVEAEASVREISRHVFLGELRKEDPSRRNASSKEVLHHHPTPLVASLLDTLTNALVRNTVEECERAKTVVTLIISDIIEAGKDAFPELTLFLHQISIRFNSMCLEDPWTRKAAGCTGITIMLSLPPLGPDWVRLREVELVRTLLHVLKNLPSDLPKDIDRVVDIIIRVLKMSYENLAPEAQEDASTKLQHVMSVFFTELPSQSVIVRESVHRCIDVAASITGKSPHDLLLPHRERGLQSLYTKPLRALQFSTQIGAIEAIRYCLRLTPPLPELNQELQRLLQEVIALASAEDHSLSGRGNVRQTAQDITKLRVACLRLLTSAVVVTEGFTKYGTTEA